MTPGLDRIGEGRGGRRVLEGRGTRRGLTQSPHVLQDVVEPLPGDELHGVEQHAVMIAEIEDGDDIGVVQPGGGARLVAEATAVLLIVAELRVQDLERHAGRQRLALGLVHDPHAAPADEPDDPIIAEAIRYPGVGCPRSAGEARRVEPSGRSLEGFHLDQGGEELADLVRQVGMLHGVFGEARVPTAPQMVEEGFG